MDLQEMTLRYDQLLKENQQLSKRLSKITGELDLKSTLLQTTQDQTVKADERAREAWNKTRQIEKGANFQTKEYEKAISERNAYFLALLMESKEAKQLRKQVEEERQRNEELMSKLQELSQSFDRERNNSLKLSETLSRQRSNVKTVDILKHENRELQVISQKLQMERNQLISELNELKDWTEALISRYDFAQRSNQKYQESYDKAVVYCFQFREKIEELQFQLSISQRQQSNFKTKNDELTREVKQYQEQRDLYGEERTKAIKEWDGARKERDEMYQQCSDAQKEKDEAVRRFLLETREFERQRETDTAEIKTLRECLTHSEEELRSLKKQLNGCSLKINPSTPVSNYN